MWYVRSTLSIPIPDFHHRLLGAITLRYLQTPSDIAVEHNSTIVFPLPIELLRMIKSTADTSG